MLLQTGRQLDIQVCHDCQRSAVGVCPAMTEGYENHTLAMRKFYTLEGDPAACYKLAQIPESEGC